MKKHSRFFAPWMIVLGLSSVLLTGCGTTYSVMMGTTDTGVGSDGHSTPWIYAGVNADAHFLYASGSDRNLRGFMPLTLMDMPLSTAADTAILPFTVVKQATSGSIPDHR